MLLPGWVPAQCMTTPGLSSGHRPRKRIVSQPTTTPRSGCSSTGLDDQPCERFRIVFLDEVAASQGCMRLAASPRHPVEEAAIQAARDRIAVAEAGDERLVPVFEHGPRAAIGVRRRIVP